MASGGGRRRAGRAGRRGRRALGEYGNIWSTVGVCVRGICTVAQSRCGASRVWTCVCGRQGCMGGKKFMQLTSATSEVRAWTPAAGEVGEGVRVRACG